ncbi:sulfopyruvate decarboxylase subunit beta [archaeon]
MKRIDAITQIAEALGEEWVVANIGFPSRELYSVKDRAKNFYMMGSMGLASSIGLGVALCCKENVWAIDGDGSVLMNLGTLSTISNYGPENYTLIILDDSSYGSTGCQPTHTSGKTDLSKMAEGAGIRSVHNIGAGELKATLESLRGKPGPHVVVASFEPGNAKVPIIPMEPSEIKNRFMEAIKC